MSGWGSLSDCREEAVTNSDARHPLRLGGFPEQPIAGFAPHRGSGCRVRLSREPNMTDLRLHREPHEDAPSSFAFPFQRVGPATLRDRLVAGTVDHDPREHAPPPDELTGKAHPKEPSDLVSDVLEPIPFPNSAASAAHIARRGPSAGVSAGVGTHQLIQQIEATLDRMQTRLDHFKQQVDQTFKFPTSQERLGRSGRDGNGNDWPPRAA